jgi:hypothetical protein
MTQMEQTAYPIRPPANKLASAMMMAPVMTASDPT